MSWSAEQYVAFEDERTRPVRDLLAAVLTATPRRAVDLGCGPGNSTEVLAGRFPGAHILGLDASADMIEAARERLPRLEFQQRDLRDWVHEDNDGPVDFILSNAVLQWVPDHAHLLPALLDRLGAQGLLAVQIPDNLAEPVQRLMHEVASAGPWAARLAEAEGARVLIETPEWYYGLLASRGVHVEVWRTTYHHPLRGVDAVVDWFRSTGLRPYLDPLEPGERQAFLEQYRERLRAVFTPLADGTVLLPFPRLFILAQRR